MNKKRKVFIGEMQVDFELLKAGDKCLLLDSQSKEKFLILVESEPRIIDGNLGVDCLVIA